MNNLVRRIGWSAVVVWAAVSIAFTINNLLPGDPARMVAGPQARPADVTRIRKQLGLDRPPLVQYAIFWKRLMHVGPRAVDRGADLVHNSCFAALPLGTRALHIDFGESVQLRQPVTEVIGARFPRTFVLAVAGLLVQTALGLTMGVFAALRPGGAIDRMFVGISLLGISAPTFLVALLLQYVLAYELKWLPLDGFGTTMAEHARCLVLPGLTLGIYGAAYYTRLVRDEMIGLMRQDWVRTASAKGLPRWRVVVQHVLRNGLLPVVTAMGLDFGTLLGGSIVTESVFRWPGLGDLSVKATLNRDGPVVVACVVVTSIAMVATTLVVDLVCARLDPRVTAERGSQQ